VTGALLFATIAPLTVRRAELDITPPALLQMGGYTERGDALAEPGGEPLMARAVVVESHEGRLAVVSFDGLTVPEGLREAVQARLPKSLSLWLVATHTHCAPDTQMLNPRMTLRVPGIAPFNRRWLDWTAGRLATVAMAANWAPPTSVGRWTLKTPRVVANRGRRPDAVPDQTAWLIEADGRPVLAAYAAHATLFEQDWRRWSGDWPGLLAARVGAPVVPAAIGDASPAADGDGPVEKRERMVEKLQVAWNLAGKTALGSRSIHFCVSSSRVVLGQPVPHPEFPDRYQVPLNLAQLAVGRFAPPGAEVSALRLGSLAVVGVPGEPTAAVARRIQAEAKRVCFPHCLVVSHVNGWIGYILEPEDYDRGGYEATLSFNGRETGLRVIEAAARALRALGAQRSSTARSCRGQSL
jgi:neutral ceramidase